MGRTSRWMPFSNHTPSGRSATLSTAHYKEGREHPGGFGLSGQLSPDMEECDGAYQPTSSAPMVRNWYMHGRCPHHLNYQPALRTAVPTVPELSSIRSNYVVHIACILCLQGLSLDSGRRFSYCRAIYLTVHGSSLGGNGRSRTAYHTALTMGYSANSAYRTLPELKQPTKIDITIPPSMD
jgi:hypothetical protein